MRVKSRIRQVPAGFEHRSKLPSSGKEILAQEKQFHICPRASNMSIATLSKIMCLCCMIGLLRFVHKRSAVIWMWRVLVVTASILSSAQYVREGSLGLCKRRKLQALDYVTRGNVARTRVPHRPL